MRKKTIRFSKPNGFIKRKRIIFKIFLLAGELEHSIKVESTAAVKIKMAGRASTF
ncbi:MAG: hypothetical protein AAF902_02215 [Chloroflexota bacterium]